MDRRLLLACGLLALWPPRAFANDEALWQQLARGGLFVLVRHGLTTPGVGDPDGMRLDACATQRNLSDAGREEARALGAALRRRGVPVARVLASPWCRCRETARLAFGGEAEVETALGNLFGRPERVASQVAALRELLAAATPGRGNIFLVTHGSTVQALTGVAPATSEMVLLVPQRKGFRVAGRLAVR